MTLAVALAGGHHVSGSPAWVGRVALAVVLLGFACITVWLAASSVRHRRLGGDDPHDGDGRHGGGPGRDPNPPDRSPGGEPVWCPEFERQFAAYVDSCAAERQRVELTASS
jgi:hypothetical protein